jgi:hypothetical protein
LSIFRESDLCHRFPFSQREVVEECTVERLYRMMLPNMTE